MSCAQTKEPWIGEIPAAWRLTAIKRIVSAKITDGPHETPELEDDGVQFISAEAIKNNQIDFDLRRGFISWELHEQYSRKCKPQRNDIFVIKSGATTGNVAYVDVDFEFSIWSPLALIRCDERVAFYKFVYYVLLTDVFRKQVELSWSFGTQQNIGMGVIERLKIPIPPIDEQRQIVAFLDASCAAIDAAVAAKRRQLDTLDALRKSTIKHAVTIGLNLSVKTQRTDVEWIPEMPQHWRLVRVKDVMKFFNTVRVPLSAAERGVMTEKTYDYYGASGVIDKVEAYLFDGTYILIAEDGANLLTRSKPLAFLATGKFWVNNHAHILKPRWGGDDTFFVTLLESQDFSLFVTGAAQPKLTMENLGRFKLAVPRVAEQKAIAAFIREKDAEFRQLFAQIERQIATLTAYRKSLIHECVTGQRRIMEADVARVRRGESESMRPNR
jgi:type I restriction enzyme S subunit